MNLRLPLTVLSCAFILLTSGCGRSKVTQCNALIEKINASAEETKKTPEPKDDATAKAYAEVMIKGAASVKTAEVEDPKLVELRDGYAKSVGDVGAALKAVAEAPGEPKAEDLEKSKAAQASFEKIVDGIQTYCK